MTNIKNLPLELKSKGLFCVWRYEERDGSTTKVPYNPKTGGGAMSNNAATFAPLAASEKVQENYDGIGLGIFNGFCAIDLDYCVTDGWFDDRSNDIMAIMNTYTEYSPSGEGLRILFKASNFLCVEDEYKKKYYINKRDADNRKKGLEIYVEGITKKYVTVTGNIITNGVGIEERGAELQIVLDKYMKRKVETSNQLKTQTNTPLNSNDRLNDGLKNDKVLIELWNGRRNSSDESGNDMSLMNKLAYWCDCNMDLMIAAFKESPYAQQKTDHKHIHKIYEREDYLIRTAQESINKCHRAASQDYEEYKKTAPSAATPGAVSKKDNTISEAYQNESENSMPADPQPDLVSKYLEGMFTKDIDKFKSFKDRKTGFKNLDALTEGLYPGLYVIGAISSLGKTTFAHQMGDQLAGMGDHVLFFSLEQNRLEMVTKSLSRITARHNKNTAVSAIKIRGGKVTPEVAVAAEQYNETGADRISIIECNFDTNLHFIIDYTKQYMQDNQVKPVIIVDYLQIIPPTDPRQVDKEKVDNIVRGLKKLQSENDLVPCKP